MLIAEANAAFERREEERDRRLEEEYQRAIAAGGDVAAEARWQMLSVQTLEETERRYDLCQWSLDDGNPGACTRRTANVFCHVHNRQLERESEQRRKAKERETAPPADPKPRPSRRREGSGARPTGRRCITNGCRQWAVPNGSSCARHNTSGWAAYKAKYPARVAFYASSTWRSMRNRQLRDHPDCVVCGQTASHADHVHAIANGGTTDGQLQSMCAKHHHEKPSGTATRPPSAAGDGHDRGRDADHRAAD